MFDRVGLLPGVDHDPQPGRSYRSAVLRQTSIWASLLAALMTVEAVAQQPTAEKPSQEPTPRAVMPTEEEANQWMHRLNSNFFAERQETSQKIHDALWRAFDTEEENPDAMLKRVMFDERGRPRAQSPEQRQRMTALTEKLAEWKKSLPKAFPAKGEINGNDAVRMLQEESKLRIVAEGETAKAVAKMHVDLSKRRESRLYTSIMGRLCEGARIKPIPLPDGSLKLTPLAPGESIVWSQDLLGVLHPKDEGAPAELTLQTIPGQGAILAFLDEKGNYSRDSYCVSPMGAPPNELEPPYEGPRAGIPNIQLGMPKNASPSSSLSSYSGADYDTIQMFDATRVGVIVARTPSSIQLLPNGVEGRIGEQRLTMEKPFRLLDGRWAIYLEGTIYGKTDWFATPPMFDRLTYKLPHTNRYEFRDTDGKEMTYAVTDICCTERHMTIRIDCPREPVSMRMHAFEEIQEEWLQMPKLPVMQPTPPATR